MVVPPMVSGNPLSKPDILATLRLSSPDSHIHKPDHQPETSQPQGSVLSMLQWVLLQDHLLARWIMLHRIDQWESLLHRKYKRLDSLAIRIVEYKVG